MGESEERLAFVYVMNDIHQGFAKVGFAADPEARIKALEGFHPRSLDLPYKTQTPYHRLVESVAHEILEDSSIHGEWFRVSAADAILAVKIAKRHVHAASGDPKALPKAKLMWAEFMELKLRRDLDEDDACWPDLNYLFYELKRLINEM